MNDKLQICSNNSTRLFIYIKMQYTMGYFVTVAMKYAGFRHTLFCGYKVRLFSAYLVATVCGYKVHCFRHTL
jgi:hypothetical protein